MILLPQEQFWKAEKALQDVPFNTIFARIVIDNVLPGLVYVDNVENPTTFLIAHPYGMSLLFGDTGNAEFNASLRDYIIDANKQRGKTEWLQVSPLDWKPLLERLLGQDLVKKDGPMDCPSSAMYDPNRVMEYGRVNFKFNETRYRKFTSQYEPPANEIVRTNEKMFMDMQGVVIPKYFWRDAEHFLKDGIGFSLLTDDHAASTVFCAFKYGHMLELGLETQEKYRGKGYAVHVCKAIIEHCLENGYEPIWSCRLENVGSYKLAQKLGFEPVLFLPYYQLPISR